jgi:hypothetical protein
MWPMCLVHTPQPLLSCLLYTSFLGSLCVHVHCHGLNRLMVPITVLLVLHSPPDPQSVTKAESTQQ